MKKNIYLLGGVSFFTDLASQMIYPLLPQLLLGMGAGPAIIGVIEGIAEATAAFFRGIFGKWTDMASRKKPFILTGYGLSAVVKPLFAFAMGPWQVLLLRFGERMGKAVRTSARDVIIANSANKGELGKSFGIHKGMDKFGSLLGPLAAGLVLLYAPGDLQQVFLWALLPAAIGWFLIFFVKETGGVAKKERPKLALHFEGLGTGFKKFVLVNAVFGLANASDIFLLLKAGEVGIGLGHVALLWFVYNLTSAVSAPVIGRWSDKVKRETIILISYLWFGLVFFGFAFATKPWMVWMLFAAFGLHYGFSKGVSRAFVTELVPADQKGTAFGTIDMVEGFCLLVASLLMGFVWELYGSSVAFGLLAALGLLAGGLFVGFFFLKRK